MKFISCLVLLALSLSVGSHAAFARCQASYISENRENKMLAGAQGSGAIYLGIGAATLMTGGAALIGLGLAGGMGAIWGAEAKHSFDQASDNAKMLALFNEAEAGQGENLDSVFTYIQKGKADITKPELAALILALNQDNEFCSRRYKSTPMTSAQALNWIEQNAYANQRERLAFRKIANEPRTDLAPVEDRSIQYNAEETARFEASIAHQQDNNFSSAN